MTMLKSLLTQDSQQDKKMDEYHKNTLHCYNSKPLWTNLSTRNDIVTIVESIIQQNYEQQEFYCCKVIKNDVDVSIIHMLRVSTIQPYCIECLKLDDCYVCGKCCKYSPIVRCKCRRTITISKYNKKPGFFVVEYSCCYYQTFGIPC